MTLPDKHRGLSYYIMDGDKPELIDGIKEIEIEDDHDGIDMMRQFQIVFSLEECLEMRKFFNLIMPNNWKKLHGLPMRRHVQLMNVRRRYNL